MRSLAVNQRNDLYLDASGRLAVARDIEAVKQNCQHAMQAQCGEMVLALDRGMPAMDVVWRHTNLVQFEACARQTLRAVSGVVDSPLLRWPSWTARCVTAPLCKPFSDQPA